MMKLRLIEHIRLWRADGVRCWCAVRTASARRTLRDTTAFEWVFWPLALLFCVTLFVELGCGIAGARFQPATWFLCLLKDCQ